MIIKPSKGFTLLEVLIVLNIVGFTTSLLVTGLNNTWRNFDKLLAKELTSSIARLPGSWFEDSIRGAVLSHPYKNVFNGNDSELTFISIASPSAANKTPYQVKWTIIIQDREFALAFTSLTKTTPAVIARFESRPRFEYLTSEGWKTKFEQPGLLPQAVRLEYEGAYWAFATPQRPREALIPAELAVFGEYVF